MDRRDLTLSESPVDEASVKVAAPVCPRNSVYETLKAKAKVEEIRGHDTLSPCFSDSSVSGPCRSISSQTPSSRGYPKPYAGKSEANNYVEMRKICTIAWVGRYNA